MKFGRYFARDGSSSIFILFYVILISFLSVQVKNYAQMEDKGNGINLTIEMRQRKKK